MANDFFRMVLWWCGMTEVLLFSDDEKIFNLTNSVIDGRYKLTWCTYKSLEKKLYPYPDIVIMYFDKEMVKKGTFKTIVQVKGRLGQRIPILTLMEEGTPQNIFSTLTKKVEKKRLVRYKEGAEMYSMGMNKFQTLAKDAGAILKIDRMVLVDLDIFDQYLETFRVQ